MQITSKLLQGNCSDNDHIALLSEEQVCLKVGKSLRVFPMSSNYNIYRLTACKVWLLFAKNFQNLIDLTKTDCSELMTILEAFAVCWRKIVLIFCSLGKVRIDKNAITTLLL